MAVLPPSMHIRIQWLDMLTAVDGETHIDGIKSSLTITLNNLGKKSKLIDEKVISLSGEHVREGLTCVISVIVLNPEFEGQTKTRLGNPEVRKIVDSSLQEFLTEYLELNPDVVDKILSKSLNALKAALAAKRARDLERQNSVLKVSSLPGKLADCSATYPEIAKIFIVEGDSAGGSAKEGRDKNFQAILPFWPWCQDIASAIWCFHRASEKIPSLKEWVELFVTEMTSATSIDDARLRDMRVLETLEKSISEPADGEAAETLQAECVVQRTY